LKAHAFTDDQRRCPAAGMDGYPAKPIRARDLPAAIEAFREPRECVEARAIPIPVWNPTAPARRVLPRESIRQADIIV
jgi:hypothetical protein